MNNQSIINQLNQYDEGIEEEDDKNNQVFNSIENSPSDKNCFIKIDNVQNNEKEMFYMSPQNNDNNSTILEFNGTFSKMEYLQDNSNKDEACKILNKEEQLIRTKSFEKNKDIVNNSEEIDNNKSGVFIEESDEKNNNDVKIMKNEEEDDEIDDDEDNNNK